MESHELNASIGKSANEFDSSFVILNSTTIYDTRDNGETMPTTLPIPLPMPMPMPMPIQYCQSDGIRLNSSLITTVRVYHRLQGRQSWTTKRRTNKKRKKTKKKTFPTRRLLILYRLYIPTARSVHHSSQAIHQSTTNNNQPTALNFVQAMSMFINPSQKPKTKNQKS